MFTDTHTHTLYVYECIHILVVTVLYQKYKYIFSSRRVRYFTNQICFFLQRRKEDATWTVIWFWQFNEMAKLCLKILVYFVAYGNTKKSLNIVTFHDKNYDCVKNSIKFPCHSNNDNFNMFILTIQWTVVLHSTEWYEMLNLWFRKYKIYLLFKFVAVSYLSKRAVLKNGIKIQIYSTLLSL